MASSMLITFQSFTRVYGGMLGSCKISSSMDMAFDARTAGVNSAVCSASIESFAALLMLRGVVVSSETSASTAMACFMRSSYSSSFFFRTIKGHHSGYRVTSGCIRLYRLLYLSYFRGLTNVTEDGCEAN